MPLIKPPTLGNMRDVDDSRVDVVYIGRPSKWGNPFKIGRDGNREEVIARYREYVETNIDLMLALSELNGKVLLCWCFPKRCHGEVLISLFKEVIGGGDVSDMG